MKIINIVEVGSENEERIKIQFDNVEVVVDHSQALFIISTLASKVKAKLEKMKYE